MTVSVRYIVEDADAAIAFYTGTLGFKVDMHPAPGFANSGTRVRSALSVERLSTGLRPWASLVALAPELGKPSAAFTVTDDSRK